MARSGVATRMDGRSWAMLLALSLVWGASFFFAGVAVRELPVLVIVAARVAVAALALWLAVAVLGVRVPRRRGVWGAFLVMGLVNNAIPFSLIVWGQTAIASGLAAILNATTPVFAVLVAHAATADETLTWAKAAGVALGLGGVAALVGPAALSGLGASLAPQLAVLGAALSYAVAGVYGRRFRRMGVDPVATAAGQLTGSTLILAPLALALARPWTLSAPSAETVAALAALALVSTAFAYVLYFRLLARAGATNVLLVTLLAPVGAILLGVSVLGETLLARHLAGMALIAAGLLAIDGRAAAALRRDRPARP